jgi:hypothetical protein
MFCDAKPEVLNKCRDTCEKTYAPDTILFSFSEERRDKQTASPVSPNGRADNDQANFCEVRTINMKRRATEEFVSIRLDDSNPWMFWQISAYARWRRVPSRENSSTN